MDRHSGTVVDLHIPRRATALGRDGRLDTRTLVEWRGVGAYVLLGDPGAGKSDALRAEAMVSGGEFLSARDFIVLGVEPADATRTLFIDGLDEMRAGSADGRVPLDAIRARLKALGCPRFRLSCREHDWRAQTDLAALGQVAPGGLVQELHLEPLSRDEQWQVLQSRPAEVPDAQAFLQHADERGLDTLFGNPLLLHLTIRAVAASKGWPESRRGIYELACRDLATERSMAHLDARPLQPGDVDRLLDDAGVLCAVLLLSGKASLSRSQNAGPSAIAWHTLPADLQLHDPTAALASKVFSNVAGESSPRHRSIAEYLAGRAVAKRLQRDALPLGRVLALMQGGDGRIVEPLRGLLAWLAVHDTRDRQRLIALDPLGVVLNGDVASFAITDKLVLLNALRDEAERNQWFRSSQWASYPFAPLASPDMTDALAQVLANHSTDAANQALVACVLDALTRGQPLPALGALLQSWVEDANVWFGNRMTALCAWKRCVGLDAGQARDWLDRLHQGSLPDKDARLAGALLDDLYPRHVGPDEVLRFWPKPGDVDANTLMPLFWYDGLIAQSRPEDFAVLADAWLRLRPPERLLHFDDEWSRQRTSILANAVEQSGDQVSDERLHAWLGIGMGEHGFSKLDRDAGGSRVAQWLTDRPQRIKAVVRLGWRATQSADALKKRYFWESEQRLHGAQLPRDWLHWLLQHAADTANDELAKTCFDRAARAAIDPPPGFDVPTMEQIEAWVDARSEQWPQARNWLMAQWSSPLLDNWQGDHHRSERKHQAQALASRQTRLAALAPHLDTITTGSAAAQVMHQLAGAHEKRFYDIKGDTPLQRVQDFLVCDEDTAQAAIEGIAQVLDRDDLPSADEVLNLEAKGKYHFLRPVALLAARLLYERDSSMLNSWPDSLLGSLVACWLTDGTGETPGWYKRTVESRPSVVAPLLVRYALPRLRRKGPQFVAGLSALSHEPGHAALARLALPTLLEGFPHRSSEPARRELNASLLAALHRLDDDTAARMVRSKLDQPAIDATQRISWLVADLPYSAEAGQRLAEAVGKNERRVVALGVALHDQGSLGHALKRVPAATLSCLIELLSPITQPERPLGGHLVTPADDRRDTVTALVNLLAADPQAAAGSELQRLQDLPRMQPWRDHLRYSMLSQQCVAREAGYAHSSPRAAALTLANRAPANQADLMALTLDHLNDIERHLRGGDTSGLRLYWKDGADDTISPKHENDCRDLLLERLRDRLTSLGVHVVPERQAADDKRADLRVEFTASGKPLAVPIEIKKEDHESLWLAWRDQLQSLYANDPAADGHGIYLVLWFGHKPRSAPGGARPASANDLQERLTQLVPAKDRARLAVCVLDLALPAQAPGKPRKSL